MADALFAEWAQSNPAEAAKVVTELAGGALRYSASLLVASQWAEADPRAAATWALSLPGKEELQRASASTGFHFVTPVSRMLEVWINRDPSDLVAWLQQLPAGSQKQNLILGACGLNNEERHDLGITDQLLALLPEGKNRDDAYAMSGERLAMYDPSGAIAWARSLRDDNLEREMLPNMLSALSGDSLQIALDEFARLRAASGGVLDLKQLSFSPGADPAIFGAWAVQQPNNGDDVQNIARAWLDYDQQAAEAWIDSLSGSARDHALRGKIAQQLSGVSFSGNYDGPVLRKATETLPQITEPSVREDAAVAIAEPWLRRDAESARQWLAAAPISDELRQKLITESKRAH